MPLNKSLLGCLFFCFLVGDLLSDVDVPDGWRHESVAAYPLIQFPTMAGLGEEGVLYVCETSGENLNNKELDQKKPGRIRRLVDVDGDGIYDSATTFADQMTFPQGALWHGGSLYVASPPSMWKLTDTDGDGVSDIREEIATGFSYTGNAADIHGPFLHPDGRMFWCHGRKGHEVFEKDRLISKAKGARIWYSESDGSELGWLAGGGMDNPVELVFLPNGDVLGTVNLFHGRPRGDVLVHWVEGGVYPRRDQASVLSEFTSTGSLLNEALNFGHVAVSGLCLSRFDSRPDRNEFAILVSIFNTGEIHKVQIRPHGSTWKGADETLFRSHQDGYHPTDVLEKANGDLLIVNSGAWFRNGCPSSLLARPGFSGGIDLLRRTLPVKPTIEKKDLRWAEGSDELTQAIASNDAVRIQVALHLTKREKGNLTDRQIQQLIRLLEHQDRMVQRSAAEAIGATHDRRGRLRLFEQLLRPDLDRFHEHAILHALIRQGGPFAWDSSWENESAEYLRRNLILADALNPGEITTGLLSNLLNRNDEALTEQCLAVMKKRGVWKPHAGQMLVQLLDHASSVSPDALKLLLPESIGETATDSLLAGRLDPQSPQAAILIKAFKEMGPTKVSEVLADAVVQLAESGGSHSQDAWEVAMDLQHPAIQVWQKERQKDPDLGQARRIRMLVHITKRNARLDDPTLNLVSGILGASDPILELKAIELLAKASLSEQQLLSLQPKLADVSPAALSPLVDVFLRKRTLKVGRALVEGLQASGHSDVLDHSELKRALVRFPPEIYLEAKDWLNRLVDAQLDRRRRINQLVLNLPEGRPEKGKMVFHSAQTLCARCHRVDDEGGLVGPDLSRIGRIRNRTDLVESILYPSSTIGRDFESWTMNLSDGEQVSGVILEQTGDKIRYALADGQAREVERSKVLSMKPSPISIMPQGLDHAMTPDQLADLLAYLESRR